MPQDKESHVSESPAISFEDAIAHARTASFFLIASAIIPVIGFTIGVFSLLQEKVSSTDFVLIMVCGLFSSLVVGLGIGLHRLRRWAKQPAMILAFLYLFLIPVGTIFGFFILAHLGTATEGGAFAGTMEKSDQPVSGPDQGVQDTEKSPFL